MYISTFSCHVNQRLLLELCEELENGFLDVDEPLLILLISVQILLHLLDVVFPPSICAVLLV